MKKIFFALVFAVAGVCTANAQVFVGGSVGFDANFGKYKAGSSSTDKDTYSSLIVSPKVGFQMSDNMAVGAEVGISRLATKTPNYSGGNDLKSNITMWGFAPFLRYTLVEADRLSVLLEGSVGVEGGKSKSKLGSNSSDGPKLFGYSATVLPVVSYNLSDRMALELSSDFLRFGFTSLTTKDDSGSTETKDIDNDFGLGINSGTGNYISAFELGIIFKF